jgi:hypothetical protein
MGSSWQLYSLRTRCYICKVSVYVAIRPRLPEFDASSHFSENAVLAIRFQPAEIHVVNAWKVADPSRHLDRIDEDYSTANTVRVQFGTVFNQRLAGSERLLDRPFVPTILPGPPFPHDFNPTLRHVSIDFRVPVLHLENERSLTGQHHAIGLISAYLQPSAIVDSVGRKLNAGNYHRTEEVGAQISHI